MRLTPREQEAMFIYVAADIARRRRERGLRLNCPESVALISEAMIEAARDGRSVTEAAELGTQVLSVDEVMEGTRAHLSRGSAVGRKARGGRDLSATR